MLNLPVFVLVSLITRPVDEAVTRRFFRIAAPWRFSLPADR